MSYFAEVENGVVTRIIVADQDFIDSGAVGEPAAWIQSFSDGTRKQMAVVGGTYDSINDVFIDKQPFPSWQLDGNFEWIAPIDHPDPADNRYVWLEVTQSWVVKEEIAP